MSLLAEPSSLVIHQTRHTPTAPPRVRALFTLGQILDACDIGNQIDILLQDVFGDRFLLCNPISSKVALFTSMLCIYSS